MRGRILFITGAALGYVIGTKRGRAAFGRLQHRAAKAWEHPRVQRVVDDAEQFTRDRVPVVGGTVADAIGTAHRAADEAAVHAAVDAAGADADAVIATDDHTTDDDSATDTDARQSA